MASENKFFRVFLRPEICLTTFLSLTTMNFMKTSLTALEVQERLKKWAEVTALCLGLLEASFKKDFPDLSEEELRLKVVERLNTFRHIRLSDE